MASWGFLSVLSQILQIQLKTVYPNMCVRRLDRRSENLKWEEHGRDASDGRSAHLRLGWCHFSILGSCPSPTVTALSLSPPHPHPTPTSCVVPYFFQLLASPHLSDLCLNGTALLSLAFKQSAAYLVKGQGPPRFVSSAASSRTQICPSFCSPVLGTRLGTFLPPHHWTLSTLVSSITGVHGDVPQRQRARMAPWRFWVRREKNTSRKAPLQVSVLCLVGCGCVSGPAQNDSMSRG